MVKQWPLKGESLTQAHQLVQEQFQQGHLKLSTSPWNTPIFVIKKKSGKYRLLHDLRAVNDQMEPMGALQPGLPNPAMIPQNWSLLIIDLKDCFFTIALHPDDSKRFAFTLPAINRGEPDKRFEWTVLPQGMRNSPTLCQLYVDAALQPLRRLWSDTIIYHYMDDILFAQQQPFSEEQVNQIKQTLATCSLVIATEKIQRTEPWKYLGWTITQQIVVPQKLQLDINISSLHDAQKLLGDLQWLRPIVGIPNSLLEPLQPLLKGIDPCRQVTLTDQQREVLQHIVECVQRGHVSRRNLELPIDLTVWNSPEQALGALSQLEKKTGETRVLEWLAPPLQLRKTLVTKIEQIAGLIKKGRLRAIEVSGVEPAVVHLPIKRETLDWYLINSAELQEALLGSGSLVETGKLAPPTLQWMTEWNWVVRPLREDTPISDAVTVFTDAGKRSRKAAITWQEQGCWNHKLLDADPADSLQTLELLAVVWAVINFEGPVNVVADSLYVAGVGARIEDAAIKEVNNKRLYELLLQLRKALRERTTAYSIIHIRSHKWNEGLGEGNARADKLVALAENNTCPMSKHALAREAHNLYHQNARGLSRNFGIGIEDERAIVRACPICSHHNGGLGLGCGVNPRGLKANEKWQMDVTHVASFGRLKYVHVTIDTYSKYIWATAQAGEKALHVIRHLLSCFPVMGVPNSIKTDNGPAYMSARVRKFMHDWGVKHITGIPNSPTGQAIIERANGTLKRYLVKHEIITDPQMRLSKVLYVLNHLCIFGDSDIPPAMQHSQKQVNAETNKEEIWVKYKDPKTGIWQNPAKVLYWGRGYLCVSAPAGPLWVPAKWTKPAPDATSTSPKNSNDTQPEENPTE
uniref:Uncharacterized protein n=1 Tax=Amazona collaria TaxID=241587 RepID=A0A8B9GBW3_9PSIT